MAEDDFDIEVVAVDGKDAIFVLIVKPTDDGTGVHIHTSARGLTRGQATALLRNYADALENGTAKTENRT